jgi:hypothetical protein
LTIIIVFICTYVEKRKSCFCESGTDLNLIAQRGVENRGFQEHRGFRSHTLDSWQRISFG